MAKENSDTVVNGKLQGGRFHAQGKTVSMLEAGITLGMSPYQICKAISAGELTGFRVGYDWRFHSADLSRYQALEQHAS